MATYMVKSLYILYIARQTDGWTDGQTDKQTDRGLICGSMNIINVLQVAS